jgi:hypothetical protein
MPKIDKIKLQQAVDTVKIFRERWLEWTQYDPIEKNAMALDTLLQSAQAVLSGEVLSGGISIDRVKVQLSDRKAAPYEILLDGMVIALCPTEEISMFIVNAITHLPKPLSISEIEKIINIPDNKKLEWICIEKINEIIDNLNNCYAKIRDLPPKSSLEVGSEKEIPTDYRCSCGQLWDNHDPKKCHRADKVTQNEDAKLEVLSVDLDKVGYVIKLKDKLARAEEALNIIVNLPDNICCPSVKNLATNYFEKGEQG